MATISETGHAKNVANLHKLIEQVSVYAQYNPPVENLSITNLQTLYTAALAKLSEVEEKRNAHKNATAQRKLAFESLKPKCTRIINFLEILELTEGTRNHARSLNRLIQGGRKHSTPSVAENETPVRTISTSRQSYTQQADNFGILLQLLQSIPAYMPNEEELKLTNLETYRATLVNATNTTDQTEAELNQKFIERDQLLYDDNTGLYNIAQNVKKYVKSLYGAKAPEYENISKIKFNKR